MKKITLLFSLTLLTNILVGQCLTATSATPQYPTSAYLPATCDGLTSNSITTVGYASEYSAVTVTLGQTYTFTSSNATDLITISADSGATAATFGIGSVTWVSTINGDAYFYTHLNDGACGSENVSRTRSVICGTPPTCIYPTAISFSNVTTTSATVSWTASTSVPANGYEYFLSTSNTPPSATTLPTGNVLAGITTFDLTALTSGTSYYLWVRSVCSNTDSSLWSTVANLQTVCTAITDFSENFDAAVAFPVCWARVGTGGNTNVQASTSAPTAPNVLYIYGTSATSQGLVSMPSVSNAGDGTHRLRFKARGNFTAGGNLEVGYLTDPLDPATFVGVQTFTTTSITAYDSFTANLGTAPGTSQTLAFRHSGTPAYSILIDNVVWETIPTCLEPTTLTASNITLATATISWSAPNSTVSNGYSYYVSTSNTAPTVATIPTGTVANGVLTADLTGLQSSSNYYFWVRANCSSTDFSAWSNLGNFATLCAPSTVPYTQDFETSTVPSLPICTSNENLGSGNNWTTISNPGSGFTTKALVYKYNTSNTADTWFYTNAISLNAGTSYTISYKYGNNSTTYIENLKVAYGDAANSIQMTNVLADHPGIVGATLTTNSVDFTPTTTGTYYFGFNCYSDLNQYYLFVDDISVTVTPLAANTFDLSVVNYYPNPVKEILNIDYYKSISKIEIYNLIGQEVNVKSINAENTKIDMSNLSNGTYLLKVSSEGTTKTIKVVKN